MTEVASPIRATRAHTAPRFLAVLALGLLLQPVILTFIGGDWGGVITPTHQHASVGAVPPHQHWYDSGVDQTNVPPGCGSIHHDHQASASQSPGVVCIPGEHIAGETVTGPILGAANMLMLLGVTESVITLIGSPVHVSWSTLPTTPPPQSVF